MIESTSKRKVLSKGDRSLSFHNSKLNDVDPDTWSTPSQTKGSNSRARKSSAQTPKPGKKASKQSPGGERDARDNSNRGKQVKQRPLLPLVLKEAHRRSSLQDTDLLGPSLVSSSRLLPKINLPWARTWPEAVNFYLANSPDYTGMGLYRSTIYDPSHARIALEDPMNLSVQILAAERAGFSSHQRLDKIMALKSWVMSQLNQKLHHPDLLLKNGLKSLNILALISALACYELVWESDQKAAAAHLKGLQRIVALVGGLGKFKAVSMAANVSSFADALHAYLYQKDYLILSLEEQTTLYYTINPFRVAFQPISSNLPSARLRNHLIISFGGPSQQLYQILDAIKALPYDAVGKTHCTSHKAHPQPLPTQIKSILMGLDKMERNIYQLDSVSNDLNVNVFSDFDKDNHRDTYEVIRNCCLILLTRARQKFVSPTFQEDELDHHVQKLFGELLRPTLCMHSSGIICWAMSVGLPFFRPGPNTPVPSPLLVKASPSGIPSVPAHDTEKVTKANRKCNEDAIRSRAISLFSRLCLRVKVESLDDLEEFLQTIWFSAPLQHEPCQRLWQEVEVQRKSALSPPGLPPGLNSPDD